jgi:hypothetical protein
MSEKRKKSKYFHLNDCEKYPACRQGVTTFGATVAALLTNHRPLDIKKIFQLHNKQQNSLLKGTGSRDRIIF